MTEPHEIQDGPLVSVVVAASRHGGNLAAALRSAVDQSYRRLQIIVANDGGEDARPLVGSLGDARILLRQWPAARGAAATLNEALRHAEGRYVCYLGAEDVYYRHHVQTLVEALERPGGCQAAHGELYHAAFRTTPEGRREVLAKVVLGARDFDRLYLLHCNYVPLTALMHRRDLLGRTGPFDEALDVLLDWDMNRRLAFFTDFLHVPRITGEIWAAEPAEVDEPPAPPHDAKDAGDDNFDEQFVRIRTRRPPKPWPKMHDLAVIFAPPQADVDVAATIAELWKWTYVPYRLYLALPPAEARRLGDNVPNLVHVPVEPGWPWDARVDAALAICEGDCIAVLPAGGVHAVGVEAALHALTCGAAAGEALRLPADRPGAWGAVFRREELLRARRRHPALPVRRSVEAEGIAVRGAERGEMPFAFDRALRSARAAEADGAFLRAARLYEAIGREHGNLLWMKEAAARALYHDEKHDERALEACRQVNTRRPTVAGLLLEARLCRRNNQVRRAACLLEQAREALDGAAGRKEASC
jgi:glycosyltransferase involved in cell wall biosynthesis